MVIDMNMEIDNDMTNDDESPNWDTHTRSSDLGAPTKHLNRTITCWVL